MSKTKRFKRSVIFLTNGFEENSLNYISILTGRVVDGKHLHYWGTGHLK
jgi:hypothetical protein